MVQTSMMWRDQMKHPDPERAIRFVFVVIAVVLWELVLFTRMRVFEDILRIDHKSTPALEANVPYRP